MCRSFSEECFSLWDVLCSLSPTTIMRLAMYVFPVIYTQSQSFDNGTLSPHHGTQSPTDGNYSLKFKSDKVEISGSALSKVPISGLALADSLSFASFKYSSILSAVKAEGVTNVDDFSWKDSYFNWWLVGRAARDVWRLLIATTILCGISGPLLFWFAEPWTYITGPDTLFGNVSSILSIFMVVIIWSDVSKVLGSDDIWGGDGPSCSIGSLSVHP